MPINPYPFPQARDTPLPPSPRWQALQRELDVGLIDALDKNGDGVDRLEFVLGMLTQLGCASLPAPPRPLPFYDPTRNPPVPSLALCCPCFGLCLQPPRPSLLPKPPDTPPPNQIRVGG